MSTTTHTAADRTTEVAPAPDRISVRPLGRVLVTGGASGLGAAVVAEIAARGGTPVVFDRQEVPGEHESHLVDLADPDTAMELTRQVAADGLNAVVACAGTDACGPLLEVDAQAWERVIRVNLLGTALVVREALPAVIAARGTIVTVASTLGLRALPDASAYCASKFGVVGFTRALVSELGDRVGVTCVIPGGMNTHFFDGRTEQYQPGPDAPLMDPAEVARYIVDLLPAGPDGRIRELVLTPPGEQSWP